MKKIDFTKITDTDLQHTDSLTNQPLATYPPTHQHLPTDSTTGYH